MRKSTSTAYLGDSVYIDRWHDGLVLTTQNDNGPPSNIIYLESAVVAALQVYLARLVRVPTADAIPSVDAADVEIAALGATATELHIAVTDGVKKLLEQTRALRARAQVDHADQG
jgi:hypothetical protein